MSVQSLMFRISAGRNDRKRDRSIPLPQGVTQIRGLSYGRHGKYSRFDIYRPENTKDDRLPTIVSIHGGGYVYGDKKIYRRYCMDLARRGFCVINFNYRLAPRWKFPAPLEDTNALLQWVCDHAEAYRLDPRCLFLVGDSAGAQIASQYAAMVTDPNYADLFGLQIPEIRILGVGLNCGTYNTAALADCERTGIALDYLGRRIRSHDPRLHVMDHITDRFPPAHITTACHDFLRKEARPMHQFLTAKGIRAQLTCYGTEEDTSVGHVFHVDLRLPEATRCNDEQCDFFRTCL